VGGVKPGGCLLWDVEASRSVVVGVYVYGCLVEERTKGRRTPRTRDDALDMIAEEKRSSPRVRCATSGGSREHE